MSNIYEMLRERIPMKEAARFYGLEINRFDNACCPFHPDCDPSLKIYEDHYHCYGCGAHGDVTDFAARLFGTSQYEAAKKLCYDFGIDSREASVILRPVHPDNAYRLWIQKAEKAVNQYLNLLYKWRREYEPHSPEEMLHPLFVESLTQTDRIQQLYEVLRYGTAEEKHELFSADRKAIDRITERADSYTEHQPVRTHRAI